MPIKRDLQERPNESSQGDSQQIPQLPWLNRLFRMTVPSAAKHLMHQMVCPNLVVKGLWPSLYKTQVDVAICTFVCREVRRYVGMYASNCKHVGMCVICANGSMIYMYACVHARMYSTYACMPGTFHSGHLVRECVCFVVMWIF